MCFVDLCWNRSSQNQVFWEIDSFWTYNQFEADKITYVSFGWGEHRCSFRDVCCFLFLGTLANTFKLLGHSHVFWGKLRQKPRESIMV